ncbi:hypothetical protein IV203_037736 [Nitzschia inconspicua]|uniref:Uncharacterized protein n=1 Tax=Nitzschia inconspicua TaxID=303405 RepID=A0A9K3LLA9_9STRA|nr:hypothetical protein IV203_037736 [Nitzschia inconspicua]
MVWQTDFTPPTLFCTIALTLLSTSNSNDSTTMDNMKFNGSASFALFEDIDGFWGTDLADWSETVLFEKSVSLEPGHNRIESFFHSGNASVIDTSPVLNSPSVEALSNPFDKKNSYDDFSPLFQDDEWTRDVDDVCNKVSDDVRGMVFSNDEWYPRRYQPNPEIDTDTVLGRTDSNCSVHTRSSPTREESFSEEALYFGNWFQDDEMLSDDEDEYKNEENGDDEDGSGDDTSLVSEDRDRQCGEYAWLVEAIEDGDKGLHFKLHAEGGAYMRVCAGEVIECIQSLLTYHEEMKFLVRKLDGSFTLVEALKVVDVVSSILQAYSWAKAEIIGEESRNIEEDNDYDDLSVVQDLTSRSHPPVVTPSRGNTAFPAHWQNGEEAQRPQVRGEARFKFGWRTLTGRSKRRPRFSPIAAS